MEEGVVKRERVEPKGRGQREGFGDREEKVSTKGEEWQDMFIHSGPMTTWNWPYLILQSTRLLTVWKGHLMVVVVMI